MLALKVLKYSRVYLRLLVALGPNIVCSLSGSTMLEEKAIYDAVCSLSGSSAPGPDGFGGGFCKACWDIIRSDLVDSIRYFYL